ncbi:hypothetical protein KKC94_00480 [Patescibacteria group bacterium]|nr:hypothetical protein [Patescibacteria group bacterium]
MNKIERLEALTTNLKRLRLEPPTAVKPPLIEIGWHNIKTSEINDLLSENPNDPEDLKAAQDQVKNELAAAITRLEQSENPSHKKLIPLLQEKINFHVAEVVTEPEPAPTLWQSIRSTWKRKNGAASPHPVGTQDSQLQPSVSPEATPNP